MLTNIYNFSRFFGNSFSLMIVHMINIIVPIITIPIITKLIGVKGFGDVALSYSVCSFIILILDFGSSTYATQRIAVSKLDDTNLPKLFSTLSAFRFVACTFLLSIIIVIELFSNSLNSQFIFSFTFIQCSSVFLMPIWLFHGQQDMTKLILFSAVPKLISLCVIYSQMVNYPFAEFVPIAFMIPQALFTVFAIYLASRNFPTSHGNFDLGVLKEVTKQSYIFGISNIFIFGYTSFGSIAVGLSSSPREMGMFAIAERIFVGIKSLISPVSQAAFPFFAELFKADAKKASAILYRFSIVIFIIFGFVSVIGVLFNKEIIGQFTSDVDEVSLYFSVLMPIVGIAALANMFGNQGLINLGLKLDFWKGLRFGGLFGFCSMILLGQYFGALGVSISILISEIIVCLFMFFRFAIAVKKLK